jgi:hypothetical protein
MLLLITLNKKMNDKLNKLIEFSIENYSCAFARDCVWNSVEDIITEYVENEDAVGDPAYGSICSLYDIRGIPWIPIKASIEDYFETNKIKTNKIKYGMNQSTVDSIKTVDCLKTLIDYSFWDSMDFSVRFEVWNGVENPVVFYVQTRIKRPVNDSVIDYFKND